MIERNKNWFHVRTIYNTLFVTLSMANAKVTKLIVGSISRPFLVGTSNPYCTVPGYVTAWSKLLKKYWKLPCFCRGPNPKNSRCCRSRTRKKREQFHNRCFEGQITVPYLPIFKICYVSGRLFLLNLDLALGKLTCRTANLFCRETKKCAILWLNFSKNFLYRVLSDELKIPILETLRGKMLERKSP
jgi:hypothetical protein